MEVVDAAYGQLSSIAGFPVDQLKYLTVLLLTYPAAILFRSLPKDNYNLKHIFSIVFSLSCCIFCLGPFDWIHSFISSLVTYAIVKFLPQGVAHKVAFVWVLGYMSASHIYRQYVDYMGWTLDFTTMQMVLTLRLSSFAFNYYDGNKPASEADEEQKKRSIKELPGLLEYFGFVYFFCSFMAGPALEFGEYKKFIDYSMFDDKFCKKEIPKSTGIALRTLLISFAFLPLTILSSVFPVKYLVTPEYLSAPLIEKLGRIYLHPTLARMKFYFAWYMTEGACILAGVGYNGLDKDGKPQWDRASNMTVFKVETPENIRSVTTYWNMKTGDWLKNYVYMRLTPAGKKPTLFATIATYSISAFWHGFYPGYYLFFLVSAFYTEFAKDARRVFRPYFQTSDAMKTLYNFLTFVTTIWFLNWAGCAFLLLSWERALVVYNDLYWIPHFITLFAFIALRFGFQEKRPPRAPKKEQ